MRALLSQPRARAALPSLALLLALAASPAAVADTLKDGRSPGTGMWFTTDIPTILSNTYGSVPNEFSLGRRNVEGYLGTENVSWNFGGGVSGSVYAGTAGGTGGAYMGGPGDPNTPRNPDGTPYTRFVYLHEPAGGIVTMSYTYAYSASMLLGSVDEGDLLTFYRNGGVLGTINGAEILADAAKTGSLTASGSYRLNVNFYTDDATRNPYNFTSVTLTNTQGRSVDVTGIAMGGLPQGIDNGKAPNRLAVARSEAAAQSAAPVDAATFRLMSLRMEGMQSDGSIDAARADAAVAAANPAPLPALAGTPAGLLLLGAALRRRRARKGPDAR